MCEILTSDWSKRLRRQGHFFLVAAIALTVIFSGCPAAGTLADSGLSLKTGSAVRTVFEPAEAVYADTENSSESPEEEGSSDAKGAIITDYDYDIPDTEGLSDNELKISHLIRQQFSCDGRIYMAYGSYISQMERYMKQDGVDLSDSETADAIRMLQDPQNVRTGAASGYFYQIGGKPANKDGMGGTDYDGKLFPEFSQDMERFWDKTEYHKSALYKNNKKYIEESGNHVYESQTAMRRELREVMTMSRVYNNTLRQRPANPSVTAIPVSSGKGMILTAAEIGLLILTVVVFAGLWKKRTLIFFNEASHRRAGSTHEDRKKARKAASTVMILSVGLNLCVAFSGITYLTTAASDRYVEESMDNSGVSQHAYTIFRDDVHNYLKSRKIPQNSLDIALTYRDFSLDQASGIQWSQAKKESGSKSENGTSEAVLPESVEGQLQLMAYISKNDNNTLRADLLNIYRKDLSTDGGTVIAQLRDDVSHRFMVPFILGVVNLILGILILLSEHHYLHRGIKELTRGLALGLGLWTLALGFFTITKPYQSLALKSDDGYVLWNTMMNGATTTMLALLGGGAVITILLGFVSRQMRKNKIRNT